MRIAALVLFTIGLTAFGLMAQGAERSTPAESTFLEEVTAHFGSWDLDQNGELSANEIELAVDNDAVKGRAAAAAAALRRAVKGRSGLAPLKLEQIAASVPYRSKADPQPPRYESMYKSALERLAATPRELFVSGPPRLDSLFQGRLGDCFLLAGLGTLVHHDPERLMRMFEPLPSGQVAVTFGDGRCVTISLPTEGETAIGARTRYDGLWANTFEKAVGTVFLARSTTGRHATPFSIIGVGGTPNTVLEMITGHAIVRVGCEDFQTPGLLQGEERERRFVEMRKAPTSAIDEGRMIVGGTASISKKDLTLVPGLYYNHSYGVLNYDRQTDVVTFWNPMGNGYKPKGPAGLKHGYPTSYGRFDCPLEETVMWFGSFSIETNKLSEKY